MAAFIATVSATVAIFGGAQLSRTAFSDEGPKHPLEADALAGADRSPDAKPRHEGPQMVSSAPIVLVDGRQPSLVDLLQGKWFGSVSSDNSSAAGTHYHDSATSMSPPDRRRRSSSGMRPAPADLLVKPPPQPPQLAPRPVGSGSSSRNSSNASSTSRQIATVIPSAHRRTSLPPLPAASSSNPTTPDWMSQTTEPAGDMSTLESETPTALAGASSTGDLEEGAQEASLESSRRGSTAAAAALTRAHGGDLFGTWARRQKHFPQAPQPRPAEPSRLAGRSNGSDSALDGEVVSVTAAAAPEAAGVTDSRSTANGRSERMPPVVAPHQRAQKAAQDAAAAAQTEQDDDDRVREKAWKWRFGRRWAAEQAKQFDPEYGRQGGDEDGWDEALGYLDACGGAIHLQIGRTVSVDKTLSRASLNRDGSGTFMLDSESLQDEGPLARASYDYYDATRSLGAKAKKAQELLRQQQEIDANVKRQWGDARAAGESWAGQFLPAVSIDMHGRFPFVLIRAADPSGMHKLLVRGKNGTTQQQLLQATRLEASQQSRQRQVPSAQLEIIGSGIMQWSRDRDRCVNVSDGRVVKGSDSSVRSNADAARLAGALTSCSLPMSYHVTVEGQRLM